MNIFIIPSWYPSKDHPHAGIFNKEQAEALALVYPDSNFAISTWGPNEEDLLLWGKDHIKNLYKILLFFGKETKVTSLSSNLIEYNSPSLTWSRKVKNGNITSIINANEKHFLDFQGKMGKVDIIHAHTGHPAGWVARWLSKKHKIPYVITEHMGPFPFNDYLLKTGKLSQWLQEPFRDSSCNIAVSPHQKEVLKKWEIPRLTCISNLTNEDFFKPAVRHSIDNRDFVFFTLSCQEPVKGIPYLLQAIRLLTSNLGEIRLRIGGDGSEIQCYKDLAQKLHISDRVEWLGTLNREEALKEYQQCDAFVLSSIYENLPLVLLEAIACGKPIISTRCGGPQSIINETNGLLTEPGNSDSLSQALHYMVKNIHKYEEAEIRADFIKRYSRKVVCQHIMKVYEQVVDDYGQKLPNR